MENFRNFGKYKNFVKILEFLEILDCLESLESLENQETSKKEKRLLRLRLTLLTDLYKKREACSYPRLKRELHFFFFQCFNLELRILNCISSELRCNRHKSSIGLRENSRGSLPIKLQHNQSAQCQTSTIHYYYPESLGSVVGSASQSFGRKYF